MTDPAPYSPSLTPARQGDWMVTASGRQIWPIDPRSGDFTIEDIAHGLSHACRYGGHCKKFYSVAQHSVLVSDIVEEIVLIDKKKWALVGLLHDASEAYIGDMIRPLKRMMPQYQKVERLMMAVLSQDFGLAPYAWEDPIVHHADRVALLTERRDLLTNPFPHGSTWKEDEEGVLPHSSIVVAPLYPELARTAFLTRYESLTA